MKLESLIIHNIASIKDATVDFTTPPLSEADVFLISGKTGAGKSTILDAICLALYDATPRLASTRMEGGLKDEGVRKGNAAELTVKANSAAQLLSRGTGEGYVRLTFKGNNGCRYEAVWSIARAYKKADKALGKPVWELRNLDTGEYLGRKGEIRNEIARAVGLDFNQFCRTTMLAQGAFARFLDSTDDEKSEILEKITGVDIYTRIGRKIYEITSRKREEYASASRTADDVVLLSDEEIEEKRKELVSLSESIAAADARKRECDAKLSWLENDKILASESDKAGSRLAAVKELFQSDGNKADRLLIAQTDNTREARRDILALRKAAAGAGRLRRERRGLRLRLGALIESASGLDRRIRSSEDEAKMLDAIISAASAHRQVFAESDVIIAHLDTLISLRTEIARIGSETGRFTRRAEGELTAKVRKAESALEASTKAISLLDDRIELLGSEIERRGLARLRSERNAISDSIADLTVLAHAAADLEGERKRRVDIEISITEHNRRIASLTELTDTLTKEATALKAASEAMESALAVQRESIDEWAKAARARLTVGCRCPVCSQEVKSMPPSDDVLRQIFDKTRRLAEAKRKEYEDKAEALNSTKAELKQAGIATGQLRKELEDRTRLSEMQLKVSSAAAKCGFASDELPDSTAIETVISRKAESRTAIDKEIASLAEVEKELDGCRRQRPALEKDKATKELGKAKALKELDDLTALIEANRTLCADKDAQTEKEIAFLAGKINAEEWDANWLTQTSDFAKELKAKAETFAENVRKKEALDNAVRLLRSLASTVVGTIASIKETGLGPSLRNQPHKGITSDDALIASSAELLAIVRSNAERWAALSAEADEIRKRLNPDNIKPADIPFPRLLFLALVPPDRADSIRERLHSLDMRLSEAEGAVAQASANLERHRLARPPFADDETAQSITAQSAAIQNSILEYSARRGAIEQELNADKANRSRMLLLVERREKARVEYERWSSICNLIGSADGKAFRKIAQSYVLSGLVDSANHYMRQLTDRYRLISVPGSFLLSIEDAYQGYARRAASTISGGETFIVSLSLALALSDIGGGLTVDTLFIDEGFGTLSGEPLNRAIDTLRMLHTRSGRKIGIISHIEELKEQLPVQIRVDQQPGSPWSTVLTTG